MGANMLDTYTLVKRLTQAGVPEAQAEAHMAVFLDMSERGFATKGDIDGVERHIYKIEERLDNLESRMGKLETRMDNLEMRMGKLEMRMEGLSTQMTGLETRLMVRLGGLIVTLMSAGFGLLELTLAH